MAIKTEVPIIERGFFMTTNGKIEGCLKTNKGYYAVEIPLLKDNKNEVPVIKPEWIVRIKEKAGGIKTS